jgi:kynurenine formamidase
MKKPFKLIDLTHALSSRVPTWGGGCGFDHTLHTDYDPQAAYSFRTHKIRMHEGIGTHMDAPAHCIAGGKSVDQLDLNNLIAPCVVIDISSNVHERYSLCPQDILAFEKKHGIIPKGSFVIIHTGWGTFWNDPEKYRNDLIFPSVMATSAELLLERQIVGLGIDTLSPDRPEDGFPVHKVLLQGEKYIVENVANATELPPVGAYSLALPLKIQGGTEAPIRLVGVLIP